MFKIKLFERNSVIFLIVTFSITGIISCSQNTTVPSKSQTTVLASENTGPVTPELDETGPLNTDIPYWGSEYIVELPEPEPEIPQPTFPANTYYKIYAPWVKWDESQSPNGWRTNVSWKDTDTLTQIWKQQIEGGKNNDGKRWFIRDGNNYSYDHRWGNYYYFDKNLNIVYYREDKGSLTLRKFRTGIIVKYNAGRNKGTWVIGGLYETVLTKDEITGNNINSLNIFMGTSHMGERNKGCLSVLTMNTGYDDVYQEEFGVDHYYATEGGKSAWYNIDEYTSRNPEELDKLLNKKENLSWKLYYVNFRFVYNYPYDWHLIDHGNKRGWHWW